MQHRALCPNERDAPAPPWVTLPLHPNPISVPCHTPRVWKASRETPQQRARGVQQKEMPISRWPKVGPQEQAPVWVSALDVLGDLEHDS